VELGLVTISSVGQAYDVGLLSDDIHALQGLLDLSLYFCRKQHISLSSAKTKLQVFSSKRLGDMSYFSQVISQVKINGTPIEFSEEAEHVGIIRSVHGNLAHL
jgi:hypothetical protein